MDYYGSMSMPSKADIKTTYLYNLNKNSEVNELKFISPSEIENIVNKMVEENVKKNEYSYMSWCTIGEKLIKTKILDEIKIINKKNEKNKKQIVSSVISLHHILPSDLLFEINNTNK